MLTSDSHSGPRRLLNLRTSLAAEIEKQAGVISGHCEEPQATRHPSEGLVKRKIYPYAKKSGFFGKLTTGKRLPPCNDLHPDVHGVMALRKQDPHQAPIGI